MIGYIVLESSTARLVVTSLLTHCDVVDGSICKSPQIDSRQVKQGQIEVDMDLRGNACRVAWPWQGEMIMPCLRPSYRGLLEILDVDIARHGAL